MVLSTEQQRVKMLIRDTITLMCKNGLAFNKEFSIDAVIGVTLDNNSLFYMSFNEIIRAERETDRLLDEVTKNESELKLSPRKRHKPESSEHSPSDKDENEESSCLSEVSKSSVQDTNRGNSLKLENINTENDQPISIKQEIDTDWDSLATEFAGDNVTPAGTSNNIENTFISHSLSFGGIDACSRQTNNAWLLGNTSLPVGNLADTGENRQMRVAQKQAQCYICNRVLRFANLRRHLNAHFGRHPYKCGYCKKGFTSKDNLSGHMASVHTGQRSHLCSLCGFKFNYKANLKAHQKKVH